MTGLHQEAVTRLAGIHPKFELIAEAIPFIGLPVELRSTLAEWMRRTSFGVIDSSDLLEVLANWRLLGPNTLLIDEFGNLIGSALDVRLSERLPGLPDQIVGMVGRLVQYETPMAFRLRLAYSTVPIARIAVLPLMIDDEMMVAVTVTDR